MAATLDLDDLVALANASNISESPDIATLQAQLAQSLYHLHHPKQSSWEHPTTPTGMTPNPLCGWNAAPEYLPPSQTHPQLQQSKNSVHLESYMDEDDASMDSPDSVTAQQQHHHTHQHPSTHSRKRSLFTQSTQPVSRTQHLPSHRTTIPSYQPVHFPTSTSSYPYPYQTAPEIDSSYSASSASSFASSDPFYLAATQHELIPVKKNRQLQATPFGVSAPLQVTPSPIQYQPFQGQSPRR